MRPLPVERLAGAPEYVRGLSVIRGEPLPVVDLGTLVAGESELSSGGRFVTVAAEDRRFALAVERVLGVRELGASDLQELPPLLRSPDAELIEAIGVADAQLLIVLSAARIISEEAWRTIESGLS